MADRHTAAQRSANMSAVRGAGNKSTEISFMSLLRKNKISGWRRHLPVEGKPDFAFPQKRVAVFVDGCFWHKCPKCYKAPKSNKKFWENKINENQRRDAYQRGRLRRGGWRVIRVWEHELKNRPAVVVRRVKRALVKREGGAVVGAD